MCNLKNKGIILSIVLTASLALPISEAASIYKWIDENGQTVYSETPPPPGVERMRLRGAPPPADDPDEVMRKLREQVQSIEQQRNEQNQTEAEARDNAEMQKRIQENCDMLRKNLEVLNSGRRIRETSEGGEQAFLDEAQVAARLKETQDRIQKECQ